MPSIDPTNPTDSSLISNFPGNERSSRQAISDIIAVEHDSTVGRHKIGMGSSAARDAITDWVVGSLWLLGSAAPHQLQYVKSIGPVAFDNVVTTPADGSVTTAKLADNAVTGAKIAMGSDAQGDILFYNGTDYARLAAGTSGQFLKTQGAGANPLWATITQKVLQVVFGDDGGTYVSASTAIPHDNTIPQNTEGTQIMTLSITPQSASSTLLVITWFNGLALSNVYIVGALFRDSVANAKAVEAIPGITNSVGSMGVIMFQESSGSTSPTTYKLRVGADSGTVYVNGDNSAAKYGGTQRCRMMIVELS